MEASDLSPEGVAAELIEAADEHAAGGVGSRRAALATAMMGLKKRFYGKGPTTAKAWVFDDYAFVAMEGGLTRNEETLLEAGKEDLVRNYRLAFQEAVAEATIEAVQEILGRRVLTYHSQIVFGPPRAFEIFVLEPETPTGQA
jgi:uncharacterized protein YbcI